MMHHIEVTALWFLYVIYGIGAGIFIALFMWWLAWFITEEVEMFRCRNRNRS